MCDNKNYKKSRKKQLQNLKTKEAAYEKASLEKKLAREEAIELEKVKLARFAEEQAVQRDFEMNEREIKNKNKKYMKPKKALAYICYLLVIRVIFKKRIYCKEKILCRKPFTKYIR